MFSSGIAYWRPAPLVSANSGRQPRATESLPEGHSVNGDGISGALTRAPSDRGKQTVFVTPGNSGSHRGLGGEMVMQLALLMPISAACCATNKVRKARQSG